MMDTSCVRRFCGFKNNELSSAFKVLRSTTTHIRKAAFPHFAHSNLFLTKHYTRTIYLTAYQERRIAVSTLLV